MNFKKIEPSNMKKILFATDFSDAANNAAEYAVDMAETLHADLFILHAVAIPANASEITVVIDPEEIIRSAEKNMLALKNELTNRSNNRVNIEYAVEEKLLFPFLKDSCAEIKPYMVIIGTQGKTKAERLLLGSHAAYILQHLPWPVIGVPPLAKFSPIKKIGLACDFENVVDLVPINEIRRLLDDLNAELHIINIDKSDKHSPELVFESGMMQEMFAGTKPDYHFIVGEDTDQGILEFAKIQHFDLLVVLPRQHNLLYRISHKSHTKQFALHSHVPVLALHA